MNAGRHGASAARPPPGFPSAEERVNCLSHAVALALTVLAAPFVAARLQDAPGNRRLLAFLVFQISMSLMYLASSLFHSLPAGPTKDRLERLDRAAIYIFIAGSYSLFAIPTLASGSDGLVFAAVWLMAAIGAAITLVDAIEHPLWIVAPYVVMGWLTILCVAQTTGSMHSLNLALLILGGVVYTAGAALYAVCGRVRFGHLLWHVLVMVGSGLHLAAGVA